MSRIGGWPKKRLYSRLNWASLVQPSSVFRFDENQWCEPFSTPIVDVFRTDEDCLGTFLYKTGFKNSNRDSVAVDVALGSAPVGYCCEREDFRRT